MAQTVKYPFNLTLANTADPGVDLKTRGWENEQILEPDPLNTYIAQGSNWAGDFKTISTAADTTLNIPASTNNIAFDFVVLTNPAGCSVNIDLTTIGTSILSLGQTITLFNNSISYSQYLVNGANPQPIFPGEVVRLFILNSTTLLNLTDVNSQVPPGTIRYTFNGSPQRGWLLLNKANATGPTTIGKSGTTYEDPSYINLYTALWDPAFPSDLFPVQGGRGASAAEDFAANKGIILDIIFGTVPAIMNGNNPGQRWGAEKIQLTTLNLPTHNHAINDPGHSHGVTDPGHTHPTLPAPATVYRSGQEGATSGGNFDTQTLEIGQSQTNISINASETGITTANAGNGDFFDARPPTITPYTFLKL